MRPMQRALRSSMHKGRAFNMLPCSRRHPLQVAVGLPPVQKAVLALLPSLGPTHLPHLWPELLYMMVRFLKPHQVLEAWRAQQEVLAEQQRAAAIAAALQQEAAAVAAAAAEQAAAQQGKGGAGGKGGAAGKAAADAAAQQPPAAAQPVAVPVAAAPPPHITRQASGQQPKHALSSAFLEKVGGSGVGRQGQGRCLVQAAVAPLGVSHHSACAHRLHTAFGCQLLLSAPLSADAATCTGVPKSFPRFTAGARGAGGGVPGRGPPGGQGRHLPRGGGRAGALHGGESSALQMQAECMGGY